MIRGNILPIELQTVGCGDSLVNPTHRELFNRTMWEIEQLDWHVTKVTAGINKRAIRSVLALLFTSDELPSLPDKLVYSFGIVHNDTTSQMRFYTGVVKRKSGVVIGELRPPVLSFLPNKEQFETQLHWGLQKAVVRCRHYRGMIRKWKSIPLTDKMYDKLMLQVARNRIIPWNAIGRIDRIRQQSSRPNLWSLLLSFGNAIQGNRPVAQIRKMLVFRRLVTQVLLERLR